jgi:hypothetical protein
MRPVTIDEVDVELALQPLAVARFAVGDVSGICGTRALVVARRETEKNQTCGYEKAHRVRPRHGVTTSTPFIIM